jgi:D-beta-D-heptose 7-phosphate kinase / D-beta-D-heptose 1-phosphate adenosyltransferase
MSHHLPHTIPSFHEAAVLVVGDIMLDRYWFGETNRLSPEAPVPVVNVHKTHTHPGGAGNVALNIKALGASVTLLAITGQDEAAVDLKTQLTRAAVKHDLQQMDTLNTIVKLRVMSRHQQLIRLDFEDQLVLADSADFIERYRQHLATAKLVVLSDYRKGTLSDVQCFIQLAREARVPVLVDPKGNDFSIYRHAHMMTPNYKEFEAIAGPCHDEETMIDKGRLVLAEYDLDALLITRGEMGMTLIRSQETLHLPAMPMRCLM